MKNQEDVIIVCGEICSGKDTFCGTIAKTHRQIVVSDIVRSVSGKRSRSELSDTADLDKEIAGEILKEIRRSLDYIPYEKVVINGIRQSSILVAVKRECALKEHTYNSIWLDVDRETLNARWESRAHKKDDLPFKDAIAKDNKLGLKVVKKLITAHGTIIKKTKKTTK